MGPYDITKREIPHQETMPIVPWNAAFVECRTLLLAVNIRQSQPRTIFSYTCSVDAIQFNLVSGEAVLSQRIVDLPLGRSFVQIFE